MQPLKSLELIRLKLLHAVNYCHALVLLLWLTGLINPDGGSSLVGEIFESSLANWKGGTSTCVIHYLFV